MNCPQCSVPLQMSDRQGVEIDYCPQCRGVWLDRGELDKLIERSASWEIRQAPAASPTTRSATHPATPAYHHDDDDDDDYYRRHGRRKKRGILGDLFDFD